MINKLCKEHGLASTIPLAKGNFISVYKPLFQKTPGLRGIISSFERVVFSKLLYQALYPSIVTHKNVNQSISVTKEKNGQKKTTIRKITDYTSATRNSKKTIKNFK